MCRYSVPAPPDGAVTLREAKEAGLWSGTLGALRMRRHRAPGFPQPVGERDGAHVYDPAALAAYLYEEASQ